MQLLLKTFESVLKTRIFLKTWQLREVFFAKHELIEL